MDKFVSEMVVIASGFVTLAIIAVLVAPRAQTGNVIGAAGKAFSGILGAAVSPVTGASAGGNFTSGGMMYI